MPLLGELLGQTHLLQNDDAVGPSLSHIHIYSKHNKGC